MRKTDARIRYTQRILKESFLILLKQKPVNKITVKEVCEMAELNRATFYAHYSDCFALLESIEQELLEAFQKSLKLVDSFDVTALIEAIYAMVEQHEDACRVLIFQGASASVLQRMLFSVTRCCVPTNIKPRPNSKRNFSICWTSAFSSSLSITGLLSGMPRNSKT